MNIDKLKKALEVAKLLDDDCVESGKSINSFAIGEYVIIRTYSAGVHFGILSQKEGDEVILSNSRRMWRWQCAKSISLSGVAKYGIIQNDSKIAPEIDNLWLQAIEIIPCTDVAAKTIKEAPDAKAE